MAKRKHSAPLVRMSSKEKMIVSYICGRLEMAYRNTAGKSVYARNMDQVMKDIFGVKKFTKTLERARYNEGLMIQLMKKLDTETLWQITRSNEHYKLLCTLIALDNQIVEKAKKLNKYQNLDGPERPTRKMRKLEKEIKRSKKVYKQVVKTFRDIFDIQKVDSDHPGALLDTLSDWLDRHEVDDDIFYGLDDYGTYGFDAIESMDAYVRSMSKKKSVHPTQRVQVGALGLDRDDSFDIDDDDGEDFLDDDDTEDGSINLTRDELQRIVMMASKGELHMADEEDDDEEPSFDDKSTDRLIAAINRGFTKMSESLEGLYDLLEADDEDDDDGFEIPADPRNARTIEQMQQISASRPVPGNVVEVAEPAPYTAEPATQNEAEN